MYKFEVLLCHFFSARISNNIPNRRLLRIRESFNALFLQLLSEDSNVSMIVSN